MNEDRLQVLYDQPTVAARAESGALPDWAVTHWETFREALTGDHEGSPFPCFFGVESVENGDPLYTVVPSMTNKDALLRFRDVLLEYLDTYRNHAEQASLVTFFKPPERDLTEAEYHERLWHVLQFLHVHDPEPWPEGIPTDPDDTEWEFSFGGEAMFPTCRAPFYDTYHSRYCPIGLEITFQPRTLFEGITYDTDAGQQAREVIHDRLSDYDGVCPHADIGNYGVDHEWPQYMLTEDEAQSPDECPINVTRDHPKATRTLPEDYAAD